MQSRMTGGHCQDRPESIIGMSLNNTFSKKIKNRKKGLTTLSVSGILKVQSRDEHRTGWTADSDSRRLRLYMIVLDNINDRLTI